MRLSKLEIYGFKSFAKRTEIVFPQNVTGIVGPNGSGKSNIADAVRWVLGEQSAKTLRGNSMSDVIFNGTQQRKAMNYCEVTLLFDNADRQLPLDYAEVGITRRVYRSGESEYLLNGTNCRLKDVVDLFRDTGVGREGYSIIGQGRIDEILSQRSEDRRAVFEEAAGISRFRARKEEAEQRLKRSDENLVRVEDLLEELGRRLTPLEKQAEVAREYLALAETLRELDIELYLLRYERLRKRSAALEDALLAVKDQLVELNGRLRDLGEERERREAGLETLQQALSEAHEALLARNEQLHRAREKAQTVENRLQAGAETARRLQGEAEAVQTRIRLIEATMAQSDDGLREADALRAAAQTTLEARREAHAAASAAAQEWEEELTRHKAAVMDSLNRMQDVRTAQARQSAMHTQMTARRAELAQTLAGADEKRTALQTALDAAKHNLAGELALFETRRAEAEALDARGKALFEETRRCQQAAQELQQGERTVETRLKTLRELQEGYEGYQYPVKQAVTRARQTGMTGVRDVVAMLLTVPRNLETAFDMALGGAMQNIVTDTEQDAKLLIDYLRQNRLGRATFLPLNAMKGRTLSASERRVLGMKGCVGLASELCGFDERYRPVMENLLGRTVVAEDLDSGIEIMRAGGHAFRLVTLAGDVMHSGGSMTGGSIQQKAQNLLGREREIKELEADLARKRLQAAEAAETLAAMETERLSLREKRQAAREALQQQEIAVVRDTERQRAAKTELDEHARAAESMREAIAQLDESIAEIEAELRRIEALTGQEKLGADAMKEKTDTLSARLEHTRREREAAQEALTAALLAAQETEHTCDRLRRDQKRLLGDSEDCRREVETLLRKREAALNDIGAAQGERDAAAAATAEAQTAVARAKANVDATEASRAEAQQALKDLNAEIEASRALADKATERVHRQEMNLSRVKADMTLLDDRLWDTYELTYAGAQDAHAEYVLVRLGGTTGAPPNAEGAGAGPGKAAAQGASGAQVAAPADQAAEASAQARPSGEAAPAAMPALKASLPPDFDEEAADMQAAEIRERIRRMGNVNVAAIEEYAQLRERATALSAQRDDLEHAKQDLLALIQDLLSHMRTVFVEQFGLLVGFFEETFSRLFGGGQGEIRLADPGDPLNCGIEIIVQPPGKKRQILSLFSGGERALTAIALLFAMLKLKPTPFCILDEIEAALDEANITYFADYLKEFSESTQFVVVTHRKGTMERCDTLFGVSMEERGVSSMVSVSLKDYA
ncbi:MAG: chromosome segregation protein SMC [Clostridiales bacterium]|nr:chromosome segregation protein SMC [Clostridiales bacterium]